MTDLGKGALCFQPCYSKRGLNWFDLLIRPKGSNRLWRHNALPEENPSAMPSPLDSATTLKSLAAAIHEHYRAQAKVEGWTMKYDLPFVDLPADLQHANLAAARRIPTVLAVAGLRIVQESNDCYASLTEAEALAILEDRIEPAAIAEHEGWMAEKIESGWRYGPERDDAARVHPSIIPYDALSEVEKEKDRSAVRNYPAMVRRAGMGVGGEK
jgi:hypothetical protein